MSRFRTFAAAALCASPCFAHALSPAEILQAEAKELSELARIERRFVEGELELARATLEQAAVDDTIARAERMLETRTLALERTRTTVRSRLRALARRRDEGLLNVLLGSSRLTQYRKRRRAIAQALRHDVERIRGFRLAVARVHALREVVRSQQDALVRARRVVVLRRTRLIEMRHARERMLSKLRARGVPAKLARARGRLQRRLRRLVRALRSEVGALRSPLKLRGRLPHPVEGGVDVPFGTVREPPFGAVTLHPGWRYRVLAGTPVRAVFAGRVVYARTLAGYGRLVIVDHGAKVHTLSAHLARIEVREGQDVATGHVIGAVGGENTPRGAGLYFELRRSGRPIDPASWLAERTDDPPPAPSPLRGALPGDAVTASARR